MGKYIVEIGDNEILYKTMLTSSGRPCIGTVYGKPHTEPDIEQVKFDAYQKGLKDGQAVTLANEQNNAFNNGYKKCLKDFEQVRKEERDRGYEDGYQQGLSDAWEAARKIMNPLQNYKDEVFDGRTAECIFDVFTASKVIARIKAWEEKQKIKVGDIVRLKDNPELNLWVTSTPDENGILFGLELKEVGANERKFERTGEHYNIGKVLEMMRKEQE